jgi:MFS transporter, DHA2 family, metal-tetracycline-proton antiporter
VGADELSWVITAYLIPFATGTVIYGRLADMYGTRPMYIFGLSLFAIASLAVALSPSFVMVVLMRALQGAGGTAVPALSLATIVRTTPVDQRGTAMGATILAVGLGFAAGPLVGGGLTEVAGWRGPFFFTALAALVLLPPALRSVPGVPGTSGQRFDYVGAILLTTAVTGNIIAFNRLPRTPGDAFGLAGLLLSLPLWALLIWRIRSVAEPFIHPDIAKNKRFLGLSVVGLTTQGGHFAVIVLIPLLLAAYHDMSIIRIGFHLLPGALALGFFGMVGGRLANRLGNRPLLISGSAMVFSAALVFHLTGVDWAPAGVSLFYVALASGYGMVNAAAVNAATAELPPELSGVGVGVFNLGFFLGGAITVALAGAILRAREAATSAFNPLYDGTAVEFSDATIVVVGFTFVGFILTVLIGAPRRGSVPVTSEPAPRPSLD